MYQQQKMFLILVQSLGEDIVLWCADFPTFWRNWLSPFSDEKIEQRLGADITETSLKRRITIWCGYPRVKTRLATSHLEEFWRKAVVLYEVYVQ
jgi:hypothetical protein